MWRSRDLNPGLSACEADTLPLSYTPYMHWKRHFRQYTISEGQVISGIIRVVRVSDSQLPRVVCSLLAPSIISISTPRRHSVRSRILGAAQYSVAYQDYTRKRDLSLLKRHNSHARLPDKWVDLFTGLRPLGCTGWLMCCLKPTIPSEEVWLSSIVNLTFHRRTLQAVMRSSFTAAAATKCF